MAQIDDSGGGGHKKGESKAKPKKKTILIDFTPMVDLGFLLITFFMLTTTMNKPKTMEINMPLKEDVPDEEKTKFKESQTMTIILGENDKIYYYFGINNPVVDSTNFSAAGIRKVLLTESTKRNPLVDSVNVYKSMIVNKQFNTQTPDKDAAKKNIARIKAYKDGLICVIKAKEESKYKNLIDILDEMSICNVGRYAVVDITPQDIQLLSGTLPTTN